MKIYETEQVAGVSTGKRWRISHVSAQRSADKIYLNTEIETMDCREQARKIYELCIAKMNDTKNTLSYGEDKPKTIAPAYSPGHSWLGVLDWIDGLRNCV